MDSGGFKKKRQNVIGISLVIILFRLLKVQTPETMSVFGFTIPINNPEYFKIAIFTLFIYFVWRFYIEWRETERAEYIKYRLENIIIPIQRKLWGDFKELYSNRFVESESQVQNRFNNYFRNEGIRFKEPLEVIVHLLGNYGAVEGEYTVVVVRNWYSERIRKHYIQLRLLNFFRGRYFFETTLPVLFIIGVLLTLLIPLAASETKQDVEKTKIEKNAQHKEVKTTEDCNQISKCIPPLDSLL